MVSKNLTEIKNYKHYSTQEIIDYCLDNKIDTIINDLWGGEQKVEYSIDDLLVVWNHLKYVKTKTDMSILYKK